jgi:hypothetical protein
MAFNVAGITLSSSAGTNFSIDNGGTPWLKVDSSGRLTREQIVAFQGHFGSQGNNVRTASAVMGSVNLNTGGAWNNSTGKFTCPVAGRYLAGMNGIANGLAQGNDTVGYGYFAIIKNGGAWAFSHWNTATHYSHVSLSAVVDCAIGDTISFAINLAPSPASSANGWYGGDRHGNFFCGLVK